MKLNLICNRDCTTNEKPFKIYFFRTDCPALSKPAYATIWTNSAIQMDWLIDREGRADNPTKSALLWGGHVTRANDVTPRHCRDHTLRFSHAVQCSTLMLAWRHTATDSSTRPSTSAAEQRCAPLHRYSAGGLWSASNADRNLYSVIGIRPGFKTNYAPFGKMWEPSHKFQLLWYSAQGPLSGQRMSRCCLTFSGLWGHWRIRGGGQSGHAPPFPVVSSLKQHVNMTKIFKKKHETFKRKFCT